MQTSNPQEDHSPQPERSLDDSPGKVLSMDRRTRPIDLSLESALTAALQAADSEFGDILQEVDKISQLLKSDDPDEQTLRIAVHPAVWSAVKQALLDRELRHLALTDDLTCLYNRRGFFAAATQLLKLATRSSQGILFLFCDFDGLKAVNDTYGHRAGDLALIRTANALENSFRGADIVARMGGDEFVAVALESSRQSQDVILRRLNKNLKKANAGESRFQLSLSIGAAHFNPKNPVSLGELMLQADQAMYQQKRKRQKNSPSSPAREPGN
jgi:diguanylate cyclase (GGDEF)-like protein